MIGVQEFAYSAEKLIDSSVKQLVVQTEGWKEDWKIKEVVFTGTDGGSTWICFTVKIEIPKEDRKYFENEIGGTIIEA